MSHAYPRRLTLLYILALGLVAVLTLSGQVLVQLALSNLEGDSQIVNIAGRQRMLSQRIVRLILELDSSETSTSRRPIALAELTRLSSEWTDYHELLQKGSEGLKVQAKNTPAILKLFANIEPHFRETKAVISQFVPNQAKDHDHTSTLSGESRQSLIDHSDEFLVGMDAIVNQYEVESRQRVERLRSIEAGLVIATLLVLLCEGLFIFSPAVRSLRKSFHQIETVTEQLQSAKLFAESASLAKTQFLTRLSHELRTPLHAILGMLSLLSKSTLTKSQKRKVKLTRAASQSLGHLVDDLLEVSRIEQGDYIKLTPGPMRLLPFIADCVALMRPIAIKKGLVIDYLVDEAIPQWILQDRHRLRQVIINLLQNAIRYTTTGSIQVFVNQSILSGKTLLKIEVIDTGAGIPDESLSRIFESFSRLDENVAVNAFGRGLGLGLPITQALVTKMGGNISVKSQVSKGTTFAVTIPLHPADPATSTRETDRPQKATRVAPPSLRALIVDDAKANRLLLKGYLRRLGIRSIEADSVTNAIKAWQEYQPALILLDRHLTDGEGCDFIQQLRLLVNTSESQSSFPKILLVTADAPGHSSADLSIDEHGQGILRVLQKPLSLGALKSAFSDADIFTNLESGPSKSESASSDFTELKAKLQLMVLQNLPNELSEIQRFWHARDYIAIEKISHRVSGSAGNAGLEQCGMLAKELEMACSESDCLQIEKAIKLLQAWSAENTISLRITP